MNCRLNAEPRALNPKPSALRALLEEQGDAAFTVVSTLVGDSKQF